MITKITRFIAVCLLLSVGLLFIFSSKALAVTFPAPSWWNGDTCDSTHFNASGQTAHLLTTWRGLQVCGYGPFQGGSDVAVSFPGGSSENEWECTELVKRYLYIVFGAEALSGTNGYNLVDHYTNYGGYTNGYPNLFTRVANDGTHHIKVGDVLSYDEVVSGDFGHTAIVTDISGLNGSGTGTITVIEQNTPGSASTGNHTQTVTSWVIKHGIDDGGTTDRVSAWLTPKQSWSNISPSGTTYDTMYSISASSTSNVWSTGYEQPSGQSKQPVTYYYNGLSWTKYSPPSTGIYNNHWLYGIATSSSSEAWTVGRYAPSNQQTLAYHWNGSSWSRVTSDNPASPSNVSELFGVAIDSSGNVYAVGDYWITGSGYQPLIEKWNGTKLAQQTISLPTGQTSGSLYGISCSSSSNCWAVGTVGNSSAYYYVIYHYDGSSWTSAVGSQSKSILKSVAIVSSNEAWAVGSQGTSGTPLILHYTTTNGWQEDTSFNGYYPASATLYGVATDGASNVWIVGWWYNTSSQYVPLTLHYNGYYWGQFDTPSVSGSAYLTSVAVTSGDAWTGGQIGGSPGDYGYTTPSPLAYQYA